MYSIHKTGALVLGVSPKGEQGSEVLLLTELFGVVRAEVQRGKATDSKHRAFLSLWSRVWVDLVLGKGGWRLVGVGERAPSMVIEVHSLVPLARRVSRLIRDLVPQSEANAELYQILDGIPETLHREHMSGDYLRGFELYVVIGTLAALGYWAEPVPLFSEEVVFGFARERSERVKQINEAIRMTQMVS